MKMVQEEYFRVIKGVINQINLYNPDNIASKYIKQKGSLKCKDKWIESQSQ